MYEDERNKPQPEDTLCKVCKGTGDECGCGEGRCAHCEGTGYVAGVPYRLKIEHSPLSREEVRVLAEYWVHPRREATLGDFIDYVAALAAKKAKA